jgi:acyl-CoA thioesterase-2
MTDKASSAAAELLRVLDLETVGPDRFRGDSMYKHWRRVYGGQVVAQAMVAAFRTVEVRTAHSLHAYFVRMGNPSIPIDYMVSHIRDGRSFSTRSVVATQADEAIFTMTISFHNGEPGLEHQSDMPRVPMPEALPDEAALERQLTERYGEEAKKLIGSLPPIEFRPIEIERFMQHGVRPVAQDVWMRVGAALPDDPVLHQVLIAYVSDYSLIDTALLGHGRAINDPSLQVASIDHALWFHRPGRADSWMLYSQDSPAASGGRALCRGSIFSRDGVLFASAAQEGLLRNRSPKTKPAR